MSIVVGASIFVFGFLGTAAYLLASRRVVVEADDVVEDEVSKS